MKVIPEFGEELCKKLIEIYDNKEFVLGILGTLNDADDRKTVIDFIDSGKNANISTITALATNLRRKRDGVPQYNFR